MNNIDNIIFRSPAAVMDPATDTHFNGFIFAIKLDEKNWSPFFVTSLKIKEKTTSPVIMLTNTFSDGKGPKNGLLNVQTQIKNWRINEEYQFMIYPIGYVFRAHQNTLKNILIKEEWVLNEKKENIVALEKIIVSGFPSQYIHDTETLYPLVSERLSAFPINLDFDGLPYMVLDSPSIQNVDGAPMFVIKDEKTGSGIFFAGMLLNNEKIKTKMFGTEKQHFTTGLKARIIHDFTKKVAEELLKKSPSVSNNKKSK